MFFTKGSTVDLINSKDEKRVKTTLVTHHISKKKKTWLIHPTYVSNMAFDFVYQRHMECFNYQCNKLFDHLEDLKQACISGLLAQLLLLSTSSLPKDDDLLVSNIMALLEEKGFFQKVQTIADNFILNIRYYLVFGMIPVKITTPQRYFIAKKNNFTSNLVNFLDTILYNISQYEIPTNTSNLLLTFTEGVITCTDFSGKDYYSLLTYDKGKSYAPMNVLNMRTPYMNMMQKEINTLFYVEYNQSKTHQKILQTNVIVSSELNERIKKILCDTSVDQDHGEILECTQSKVSSEIENLDRINKGLKTASINSTSRSQFLEQIGQIDETFELTNFLDKTMRNNIKHMQKEMDPHDFNQLVDSCSAIYAHSADLHDTVAPADAVFQKKVAIKVHQEDELKRRVQMLVQENKEYKKYTPILRDQLLKVIQSQTKEALKNRLLEQKKKLLFKEIKDLENQLEVKNRDVKDYERLIKELQTLLKSSFELIKGETKCHSILMDSLLKKVDVINPSQEDIFKSTKYNVINFLNKIFPFDEDNKTKVATDNVTSVFDTLEVKAIPFFSNIQSIQALKQNNLYLRNPNKEDALIDGASFESTTTPIEEVHFIDINQKQPKDEEIIRDILRKNNVIVYPGEEIFNKRFLNVQFPKLTTDTKNPNNSNSLLAPLKSTWEQVEKYTFKLHNRGYTVTGQTIAPKIGVHTINWFIIPFIQQCLGSKHDIIFRISSLILNENNNMEVDPILEPLAVISNFVTSLHMCG
jgi:hypothetical protein